ncbi:MAG TPA: hypothetical protein PKC43_07950 [Phycisphaerales bacterium]|nr:hypothetical protein [Phycisphaerales bacterium]HMP37370.1 hypothetical protein [Phycisphaerales bacterium]
MNLSPARPSTPDDGRDHRREEGSIGRRDPISGAPGARPVGTGIGAAAGGAAGAGIGAVAGGPVGAAIGAVTGAVAGGLAGKGVAARLDPAEEETFWRDVYESRPYVDPRFTYEDYGPAYRYGWERWASRENPKIRFDDLEEDLRDGWERAKRASRLTWAQARDAAQESWKRVSERFGPDALRADDDGMPRPSAEPKPADASDAGRAAETRRIC